MRRPQPAQTRSVQRPCRRQKAARGARRNPKKVSPPAGPSVTVLSMVAPSLSVIIPVRIGGAAFAVCLEALSRSKYRDFELVVVDDGSSDGSDEAARRHDATVLTTGGAEGPAAARNLGAAVASAETLLFLDADCEVHEDTLDWVVEALTDDQLVAVFGSYDDEPKAKGIVSRFRNLLHHFVHQTSRPEIETFWAGCGAVRKQAFLAVGGFDAERYQRPSIEDIDLGYRLTDAGGTGFMSNKGGCAQR